MDNSEVLKNIVEKFVPVSDSEIKIIMQKCDYRKLKRNTFLLMNGDVCKYVYFILKGCAYQVLVNTMFDLLGETKPLSRSENAKGYRLQTKDIEDYYVPYYLNDLSEAKEPMASPMLAKNFRNLPDACVMYKRVV